MFGDALYYYRSCGHILLWVGYVALLGLQLNICRFKAVCWGMTAYLIGKFGDSKTHPTITPVGQILLWVGYVNLLAFPFNACHFEAERWQVTACLIEI